MLSDIELSELLMVRFAHDLSGLIGAISNGVELLGEENEVIKKQSIELVEASAKDSVARLMFYRNAYGTVSNKTESNIKSLLDLMQKFFVQKKISVEWSYDVMEVGGFAPISGEMGRILVNVCLLVSDVLIMGGKLKIKTNQTKEKQGFIIRGEGASVKVYPYMEEILSGELESECITVKNIQAYWSSRLMKKAKLSPKVSMEKDYIEIAA